MSPAVPRYPNAIAPEARSQSSAIFGRRPKQHRNPTLTWKKVAAGQISVSGRLSKPLAHSSNPASGALDTSRGWC